MNIEAEVKTALRNVDETQLLRVLFSVTSQEQKAVVEANKWILCRVCELGFTASLEHLLDLRVLNVNDTYDDWTPLQYACKGGHTKIVQHLVKWDAELKQDAWKKDSEFYLVTFYGHAETAKALYEKYKDLVEDSDICYSLLYTACQGGHVPLVHMWLKPGHDINQLVSLVPNLDSCEYCYPLFAACQGNHMEVAVSLIKDCEALLTQEICKQFTEFTSKLISDLALVPSSRGEVAFCLTKLNVEYPMPEWFHQMKEEEDESAGNSLFNEVIILSEGNCLHRLSGEILWHLPGLKQLDVSKNPNLIIEEPLRPSELMMNRLVSLDVSNCKLESVSSYLFTLACLEDLNLSHNNLTLLGSSHSDFCSSQSGSCTEKWKCGRLKFLDVSHNNLHMLPHGLQGCSNMDSLIASHNQLTTLCPPWTCPITTLNVSHNLLGSFPASAENFWKKSLKRMHIQHNQLDQLPSSIVALDSLRHLNASHNKIATIPAGEKWRCRLFYLNLSHNEIGVGVRKASLSRVMSMKHECPFRISICGTSMAESLTELFLGDNNLKAVPDGIAEMINLSLLDLKRNPSIMSLPHELGKLQKLLVLDLEGISVEDKELQILITGLNKKENTARDVIMYLESKRRNCTHSNIFKVIVLGKEKKVYEKTLIQELASRKKRLEAAPAHQHEEMFATQIPLNVKHKHKKTSNQPGHAVVWEFPASKFSSSVLPCFLTHNTLYLLELEIDPKIIPISDICLRELSEKVASVQACVLRPEILVVLIFPVGTSTTEKETVEIELLQKQRLPQFEFSGVKFFSFCARTRNLDKLWEEVENICMTMCDSRFEKKKLLAQRKVPHSFLQVYQKIVQAREEENIQVCTMDKFLEITGCTCKDLKDFIEPETTLEEFLLQSGAILHYSNFSQDLTNCVFLDPAWLFKILTTFLKSLTSNMAKLSEAQVKERVEELLPSDCDYFQAFLALLETFNIGFRIVDSSDEKLVVIPSLLQERPPLIQLPKYPNSLKAARLYRTPTLPLALWSHVISQLILAFNRFSQSHWKLGAENQPVSDFKRETRRDNHKSFKMSRSKRCSMHGLKVSNQNVLFWRTGIFISHDQGYVVVEEVECSNKRSQKMPGILVTVQTNGSNMMKENLRKLAVIGIIKDELEEILEMFVPKFSDPLVSELKPFALCPHCHDTTPMLGQVKTDGLHFTARDCAQAMLREDKPEIVCQGGPTSLQQLVPELFFLELPENMLLNFKDLTLYTNEKLGRGIAGEVLKGCFKGQDVAVKVFHQHQGIHQSIEHSRSSEFNEKVHYTNCHPPPNLTYEMTQDLEDKIESEQRKISNAFSEVRREVGILSKLQHRCIVNFVGVCVQPDMLLVMELAPLGSLRSELERRLACKEDQRQNFAVFNGNSKVISDTVFSRHLTYKMILQIASGLSHLHSHQIIFRDLKPDNILLMSLEENYPVNVKLSDYGISKFASLQGISGLFGTVGYIAPEVLTKQAYTRKVDIFSLGIVMGEILTGIPPVAPDQPSRVSDAVNDGVTPGHMQGYEIHCNFPCLEELMKECWHIHSEKRPEAAAVVKRMKAKRFLLMYDSVWLDEGKGLEVTCVYACETAGHWAVWICESSADNRRFFSVYDITINCYSVKRMESNKGSPVTTLLRAGTKVWLACQGEQMLYTLTQESDMFKISPEVCLGSVPNKLTLFKSGGTQKENTLVLVGLQDGSVTSVNRSLCGKTCTINKVELEASQNECLESNVEAPGDGDRSASNRRTVCSPVACICQVGTDIVAVASGEDINTLSVKFCDVTASGTLGSEVISPRSKISLKYLTEGFSPISAMASDGGETGGNAQSIWCCLESSPFLIQVDVLKSQVILKVRIGWHQGQETMHLERLPCQSPGTGNTTSMWCTELPIRVSRVTGKYNTMQIPLQKDHDANIKYFQSIKSLQEPEKETVSAELGFSRVNMKDPPRNSSYIQSDSSSGSTNANFEQNYSHQNSTPSISLSYGDMDEDGGEKEHNGEQLHSGRGEKQTDFEPIYTNQIVISEPPPVPPRQNSIECDIRLYSLTMAGNVLMIGTNCGGLLAFPLALMDSPGGPVVGGYPSLHLEIFWHQQKALPSQHDDKRQRKGSTVSSYSTTSCLPVIPAQPRIPVGEVSLILKAGDKMVSMYTQNEKINTRSKTISKSLSQSHQSPSQNAGLFPPTVDQDNEKDGWDFLNIETDNATLLNVPNRNDPPERISDITVWDHISSETLLTIKNYCSGLS